MNSRRLDPNLSPPPPNQDVRKEELAQAVEVPLESGDLGNHRLAIPKRLDPGQTRTVRDQVRTLAIQAQLQSRSLRSLAYEEVTDPEVALDVLKLLREEPVLDAGLRPSVPQERTELWRTAEQTFAQNEQRDAQRDADAWDEIRTGLKKQGR